MDEEAVLELARTSGASHAELRLDEVQQERIQRQDQKLDALVRGGESGFSVRVLVDGAWGFAAGTDLSGARDAVERAVRLARAARTEEDRVVVADGPVLRATVAWTPLRDPADVSLEDKMALLVDLEKGVLAVDGIRSVDSTFAAGRIRKRFLDTSGTRLEWQLWRTIMTASYSARRDGHLGGRGTRVGGTQGWELFQKEDPVAKSVEAAKRTVAALGAPTAKGGKQTVVIDSELAGVFAHEAVGHASESDLIVAGESCFKGRLGERLGVEGLTITDDSTIPGAFGSFPFDDNGVAGGAKPILRDGVLSGFLLDREHAGRLSMQPNGAARAQDVHSRPLVRMSNTMVHAGSHAESEVFDVKDGIYCKGSRGGQVDCARGTFLFNAQEAFRIENGEVTTPLRDVSLTGDILSTLRGIDAIGNIQRMGDPGHCGKGQWVPVCDGGPLLRIRDCLVGGA